MLTSAANSSQETTNHDQKVGAYLVLKDFFLKNVWIKKCTLEIYTGPGRM